MGKEFFASRNPWLSFTVIFSVAMSFWNFQNREYGWDLTGYLGSHYQWEHLDQNTVHQKTYSDILAKGSPQEDFLLQGLDNPTHATHTFATSDQAFAEQLPYYQIKVLYNALISFFSLFGIAPVDVPLLINAGLTSVLGILLFFTLAEIFTKKFALSFLLSALVLILPPIQYMGSIGSPDLLSVIFLVLFLYSVIKNFGETYIFLTLLLLVFSRPDFITFGLSYYVFLIFFNIFSKMKFKIATVVFPAILAAVYFGIISYYQYPGWKDVFQDSFMERRHFISKEPAVVTWQDYQKIILKNGVYMKKVGLIAIAALLTVFIASKKWWARFFALFLFGNLAVKFLFFPAAGEYRFFAGILLISVLWATKVLSDKYFGIKDKIDKKLTEL